VARGYKFSTYAYLVDSPGHTRAIADQARHHPHPVHMIETINKLVRTSRQLVQELGREPTSGKSAKRMDIPVSKVRKILKIGKSRFHWRRHRRRGRFASWRFHRDKAVVSPPMR